MAMRIWHAWTVELSCNVRAPTSRCQRHWAAVSSRPAGSGVTWSRRPRRGETAKRRTVRLRVPPGIGRMNMLHLNVAGDGTAEMPEEEAESFFRAGWVRAGASDAPGWQSGDPPTARPEPLSVMAKRLAILRPL